jgi:ribosomal protein S18 acetylase RimI-like enzyme
VSAIRPARRDDLPALRAVAADTGMFLGDELDAFLDMADEALSSDPPSASLLVGVDADDRPVGAAFFAAERMAQGVTNLLFVGVSSPARRRGLAAALLARAEAAAREAGGRLMIVETADAEDFGPARALYESRGYEAEARVRDFYDAGLDKLIFRKAL